MRRALLADLHLGQAPGDGARFRSLLPRLLEEGVGELILAGDVFRTLVGFPRFWTEEMRATLEALAQARKGGLRVVWVEGNRDFFLDAPAMEPFRDRFVFAYGFTAGSRRFLVEHGDLLNKRDWKYRFWRALSKSSVARFFARLLPSFLATKIVSKTEKALAKTNFTYRRELPVPELVQQAQKHFAAGVDVVLWGHFHRCWSFRQGQREAHVVPPWLETGGVVYIEEDGLLSWPRVAGQFVDKQAAFCYQAQEAAR